MSHAGNSWHTSTNIKILLVIKRRIQFDCFDTGGEGGAAVVLLSFLDQSHCAIKRVGRIFENTFVCF